MKEEIIEKLCERLNSMFEATDKRRITTEWLKSAIALDEMRHPNGEEMTDLERVDLYVNTWYQSLLRHRPKEDSDFKKICEEIFPSHNQVIKVQHNGHFILMSNVSPKSGLQFTLQDTKHLQ